MEDRAAAVRAAVAGTTTAVRRRDMFRVAYVWTMSNGSLARRLGRAGWLLLPVSWPVQLLGAALVRPTLVRNERAAIAVRLVGAPPRPDPLALLVALMVGFAVWLPLVIGPLLVPRALAVYAIWLPVLLAVLLVGDMVVGPARGLVERLRHAGLDDLRWVHEPGDVFLAGLAAYPRGGGHGTKLMLALVDAFDTAGVAAEFDVRADSLMPYYATMGYRPIGYRRMRREPAGPITVGEPAGPATVSEPAGPATVPAGRAVTARQPGEAADASSRPA